MTNETFSTDLEIKALKSKCTGKVHFYNGKIIYPGSLGLRISPMGKTTWLISYRSDNKKRKFSFGTYPQKVLKQALKEATDLLKDINEGTEPNTIKQQKKDAPTMCDLWDAYQKKLSNRKTPKATTTTKEEIRRWNNVIKPAIGSMKVEAVRPVDLNDLLEKHAEKAPVSANRLHSLLSVLFKPALAKGWITIHPLQYIDKPGGSEAPRKRVLSNDEIKAIWPALCTAHGNVGDILKLCLLTAQRSGEIRKMKWSDVDFDARTWIVRDTKTGNDHLCPLSPQAIKILKARSQNAGWVFDAKKSQTGHTVNITKSRKKIHEDSGTEDWTAHDLRRTARTLMSKLGVKSSIAERCLNHSVGGIQGVYDLHSYFSEKAIAFDKLGQEINKIIGVCTGTDKVIQLRRQA